LNYLDRVFWLARGDVHINSCENMASLLRTWLLKDKLETYLRIFKTYRNLTNKKPELSY